MKRFALTVLILSLAAATAVLAAPPGPRDGSRGAPGAPGGPGGPPGPGGPGGPDAAPRPEGPGAPGNPPFARDLFPPELVLHNQIAIGLSAEQVGGIKKLLNETHSRTLDIQTDLSRVAEKLGDALEPLRVDEAVALGLADQVMRLETEVKKTHLGMLIRLKNLLTPEQQEKLRDLQPRLPRT